MDRSKFRIGLLSMGIIAGLTLILYLPVLIWSPPWGEDGYYVKKSPEPINEITLYGGDYYSFTNNVLKLHSWPIAETDRAMIFVAPSYQYEIELKPTGKNNWMPYIQPDEIRPSQEILYKRINNDLHCGLYNTYDFEEYFIVSEHVFIKIQDPFTLWYIKWLEWTAD